MLIPHHGFQIQDMSDATHQSTGKGRIAYKGKDGEIKGASQ
jgi:hypothetical protein